MPHGKPRKLLPRFGCAAVVLAACAAPAFAAQREAAATAVEDLAYGEVLFHFYQEDYLTALTRLLAARSRDEIPNHGDDAELLLGGLYLSYGQHVLAGETFERILAERVDPAVHDRAWFFLAKIWQQRGYVAEAERALERIGGPLPDELEPERRLLHARVLMDQGRFDDARERLEGWSDPRDDWSRFARYNLGVALVRLGRVEEGTALLDAVGRQGRSGDAESLAALRDKANVAVGYAWLQADRPERARDSLRRVRLNGAFSNKALLGAGWADAQLDDYRGALVPWLELQGRGSLDSAVQESLLAVPYAFAQLGADGQAAEHYSAAIAAFEDEVGRVDRAIASVRDGRVFEDLLAQPAGSSGWYWRMERVPDSAESRYLYELLSTHRFQEVLKNYRDLIGLIRNLDGWAASMSAFDDILDTRQRAYEQRLPAVDSSLGGLDLDAMAQRRVVLESRLRAIERTHDVVALGTPEQQDAWEALAALEPAIARLAAAGQAEALRGKHRFLQGLLRWDLERDYKARLWQQEKQLRRLEADIREAQRRHRVVTDARDGWPERFGGMKARIDELAPRLESIRESARRALARQYGYLEALAVEELDARRRRLDAYRVQARFSLAAVYDRAAAVDPRRSAPAAGPGTPGAPADGVLDTVAESRP